jgi:hypothetical protein
VTGQAIMSRSHAFAIAGAVALVTVIGGAAAFHAATPPQPQPQDVATRDRAAWTEVSWPFPLDQWGRGRAFQCKAADCAREVNLYLRAKVGFCNCATGVADDEELDRVSDVDLVGGESAALGPGRPIGVHWMKGRSRGYALGGPGAAAKSVLSIAFNDRCDVIVATIAVGGDEPAAQEEAALAFLNGDLVLHWAQTTLGL